MGGVGRSACMRGACVRACVRVVSRGDEGRRGGVVGGGAQSGGGTDFLRRSLIFIFCFITRISPPRLRTYRVIVTQMYRRIVSVNYESVRLIFVCFELLSF